MGHNSGDLFELMGDILATARLDDKARFSQMVAETKANMEAGIVGSGHRCVFVLIDECGCVLLSAWDVFVWWCQCGRPLGIGSVLSGWMAC